jgi:hypothetical protein
LTNTAPQKKASATKDASAPAFKPRKVKKKDEGPYRDRAEERRLGKANDYAQVEAVLEEFERRNADEDDVRGYPFIILSVLSIELCISVRGKTQISWRRLGTLYPRQGSRLRAS